MFFQKKCLFSIPIPFRTLCWLCFVQSLVCPYFGILAENPFPRERGYITGATAPDQARMLAVSHTKPLHDAVVQMADDLYGGLRPSTPFFNNEKVFLQTVNLCFLSQYHLSMRRHGAITAPLRNPLPRRTFLPVRKTNPLHFRLPHNLH